MSLKEKLVDILKFIFVAVVVLIGMVFNKRLLIGVGKVTSLYPTIVYNFNLFLVVVLSLPFSVHKKLSFGLPGPPRETPATADEELVQEEDVDELVSNWGTLNAIQQPVASSLADITTPQVIELYGYTCETHKVRTEDGYILTMHRIPYGRGQGSTVQSRRPVVFMQHGLFASSFEWFMNSPDKLLGLQLVEEGYDVWFGNMRGNTYSREHVTLSPKTSEFWQFSVHEMGKYDLPAEIDHVLAITGVEQIRYIGYSMGSSMFWIMMSLRPEYNDKVKVIIALAPVVYINNVKGFPKLLFAPFRNQLALLIDVFFHSECMPPFLLKICNFIFSHLSSNRFVAEAFCANVNFFYPGWDLAQTQIKQLPLFYSHTPAPTSARTLVHMGQLMMKGVFAQYDWGVTKNLEVYGQPTPPKYFLSRTKVPVALIYGLNDAVVEPSEVQRLAAELPNVISNRAVNFPLWNHFDFHLAKDVNILLNAPLIQILSKFKSD